MFIELVDALRCPNRHEESWLVVAADRMEHRHIVSGTLGCPVCEAEFPIHDGVVDFRIAGTGPSAAGSGQPAPGRNEAHVPATSDARKLAALLNLSDAQGFAVLLGDWGALAGELAAAVETPLMLVDPPDGIVGSPGISVVRSHGDIPLAAGAARAVAVEGGSARVADALRVVRPRGRVVAPVSVGLPADVRELARDESVWVGERSAPASPLVSLHVRRG